MLLRLLSVCVVSLIVLAPSAHTASLPSSCCSYRFDSAPAIAITLPRAQPDSPGDIRLNAQNDDIVSSDDTRLASGCNGDHFQYWDADREEWIGSYLDDHGELHEFNHVFYATGSSLMISTLQTWQSSSVPKLLNGRIGRMLMTCNNEPVNEGTGCAQFTIGAMTSEVANRDYTPGRCSVNAVSDPVLGDPALGGSVSGSSMASPSAMVSMVIVGLAALLSAVCTR